ncbi:MAG TPA: ATP-binding protein [Kofleriaceae bacterium]|nr:ATP-binding protein [Kofleriaceae bacterium]
MAGENLSSEVDERDRARQFALIFQQIPGAIWSTDRDLRITYAVGRAAREAGFDHSSVVGQTVYDIVRSRDPREPVIAHHLAALNGARASFRYQLRGRWYEVLIQPLSAGDGPIGCVGSAIDVTDRRRTEEELEESRRRLSEAQSVARIGSFEWDVVGDRITWSEEMARIHGVPPDEAAQTFDDFLSRVHPDDLQETRSAVLDAVHRRQPIEYDHRIVRRDGQVRILHTRAAPICDEGGRVVRLVGSCWDVTEQVETTRSLERTVSVLQATLHSTADGILVVDSNGAISAFNKRFLDLWHIPSDLASHGDDDALLAFVSDQLDDPGEFLRVVRDLYELPDRESFDVLRFRDGRVYERVSRPQRIGNEVVGRVWSFHDVTERERLLRSATFLSDATRLLASLDPPNALESVARMAIPYLGDGCAVDLLGFGGPRRLLAITRDPARPFALEVPRAALSGHATIFQAGDLSCMSVPMPLKEGVAGTISFVAAPHRRYTPLDLELAEELGRRAGLAIENARLLERTREALRARDEFLSIAAHEIRGPVTSIHLAVQSLIERGTPDPIKRRLLDSIERADRRLARFVDELLDVGRIQGDRLHFQYERMNLGDLVREVAGRFQEDAARAGSSLSVTIGGDLRGEWDRFRLDQVLTNLISNAIKFGLGRPIEVTAGTVDGMARVSVRDHGLGIPPDKRERIFRPFERAVPGRQYGGLGLGLYIVRTIMEGLGGEVRVDSEPGGGSTFTLTLPQKRAE